ncbi:MAG: non-ribosomal peptide synthetase [Steroidobacteraceae bacterium]|jgi:acyl-CoA synthetase (AMP-forming)/AMP-acid ligase II/aryl carrier-like protein
MNPTTLSALMHANRGAARSITYLEGENESRAVAYGELYERALGILYHLQQLGARPGDRLILLLGANEPFIDVFWAAVLGGIIPVPLAPGISDEHRHKLLRIARQLGTPFLYTEQRLLERLGAFAATVGAGAEFEALRARTFLVDDLDDVSRAGREHEVREGDTAFIQFSSGSTSTPKGVVLSHANLIANIRGATEVAHFGPEDVSLSWMPLTHDMGLIGFHLVMFANRVHTHLMPTDLFVRRPLLWLQFASRVRASILCSPNFGYRHYLKVLGERAIADLDLSSVRLIFNGAEPISVELCEEFLTRMTAARLKRESMYTVYGLAEASLAVSFPALGRRYRTTAFNRHQLGVGQAIEIVGPTERNALLLASVGKPIPYCEVRIGDEQDGALPEHRVGHIQIRGANVTAGYLDAPETNAESFTADGWLRTGDLGVFHDGELYVTGRHKEILFVNGQNYYPHDLESLTHDIEGLDLGKVVVAGVRPEHSDSDQIIVFVWYRGDMSEFLPLARQVARRIGEHAGIEITAVVPVKRIPKTTSGKIQRHLLEHEYLAGAFAAELAELAALAAAQPLAAEGHGAIEATLQGFCENALEGRRVGRLDNLFDAGISSLRFMAIHEQIEQRWPGLLDITDLFDHPTVAELAHFIESRQGSGDAG